MRGGLLALEFLGDCAFDEGDYEAAYRNYEIAWKKAIAFPRFPKDIVGELRREGRVSSVMGDGEPRHLPEARAGLEHVESCVIGFEYAATCRVRRWLLRNWATFERQNAV